MSKRFIRFGLVVAVLLVLSVVLLGGCSPKQKPPVGESAPPAIVNQATAPAPEGAKAPAGEPVKIGAIFSVTGPNAPLGEPEKNAAEMLVEEANAKGGVLGRPLAITIKDDKTDPNEAVLAAKDLINNEKVCAIIGPSGTPTTMAIKAICEENKIPLVSCAAGQKITNPVSPYVFAVPQTDTLAVKKILDYLKAQNIKKVATIYVTDPFGESGQEQLKTLLPPAGVEIVGSETYGKDDTDMTPQITKIRDLKPQAIICWGTNPGPAHVARAVKKLSLGIPLIQSHGVANAKFLELAGDAAEGVMLPAGRLLVWESIPDSNKQKPVLKAFAEAYKAKYGTPPNTFAGHAYDAFGILVAAIQAAGSTDRTAIRDAVEKTKDFVGTAGIFNYSDKDHNGLTKDAFVWIKVEGGKWKLAE
jgi:branched-chain amino acid transport system substrate-binding protein